MRLAKLRVRGFKRLQDVELDLDHDRVLVVGPNEAGKSTLMEALFCGLYGLAPAKRGSGHAGALRQVLPWSGEPAGLALTCRLDDGRLIEVDWDLSGERTQVIDHSTSQDISATFATGTHGWLDVGDSLLNLPGNVFAQVTCVGEGELALITDDVEVRQSLLRVTDSGVDVLVEQALRRLEEGARQASIPKVNAATRRNDLGRQLAATEAQLADARLARQALEGEVAAIDRTERALKKASSHLAEIIVEEERRHTLRTRLSAELERSRGRLTEAELRLASLQADRRQAAPGRIKWTDAELEQAREKLVAGPRPGRWTKLPRWPSLAVIGVGLAELVVGIILQKPAVEVIGAAVIAVGVFLATRSVLFSEDLTVGGMSFSSRQQLMSAMDCERARRDYAKQLAESEQLQQQLNRLLKQPPPAEPWAPRNAGTVGVTEVSNQDLERRSQEAAEEQQRLTIELAQRRASLERGASQIPEVAALEERVDDLRQQVDHLDAFGVACRLAGENLAQASEELRRAYAPKLQAYLSRDIGRITDGRYTEALVNDKFEVLLRAPETKSMVDLRRISRGTQQQIYLLLRLGLLQIMGAEREALPLFLDDALALADDERRREILKVLEGEKRQVIYFTAGESTAAVFSGKWRRLILPRPTRGEAGDVRVPAARSLRVVDNPRA